MATQQDNELKDKIERLRDLRSERSLEIQILQSRENWFWIPWTICLAAGFTAQYSNPPAIRTGICLLAGMIACFLAWRRHRGIAATLRILAIRQRAVLAIVHGEPRLANLGFGERGSYLEESHDGKKVYRDPDHEKGFQYPLEAIKLTPIIWLLIIAFAIFAK